MICAIAGQVEGLDQSTLYIRDFLTQELHTCLLEIDSVRVSLGSNGLFVGQFRNNAFRIRRIEARKFLDPMYEADLHEAAALITLIEPINNPFPDALAVAPVLDLETGDINERN